RQTLTVAPRRVSSRSRITALYAAIEPVTPRTISRPSNLTTQAFGASSASLMRYSTFAAAISSSAELVGFLWLLSTRGGAPRLSWRARFADSTTRRYRLDTLLSADSSEGKDITLAPPGRGA